MVRYFPVSQDINADPEVWELTDKFGDRALRVWLEILSIADRNGGVLPGLWSGYPSMLAGRCKSTARHLRDVCNWIAPRCPRDGCEMVARCQRDGCEWVTRWLQVDCEGVARVVNYPKYHKLRAERGLAPNLPNLPNHDKNHKTTSKPEMSIQEFVESWNECFADSLPKVEWPLAESRKRKIAVRLKEHQSLEFWKKVFSNIAASNFLLGRGNGTWKANIDWLTRNDSNCLKVYEGSYENGKSHQVSNQGSFPQQRR